MNAHPYPVGIDPQPFLDVANDPAKLAAARDWLAREVYPSSPYMVPALDDLALTFRREAWTRKRIIVPFVKMLESVQANGYDFHIEITDDPAECVANGGPILSFDCCGGRAAWTAAASAEDTEQLPHDDGDDSAVYAGWAYLAHQNGKACSSNLLEKAERNGWLTRPGTGGQVLDWELYSLFRRSAEPQWLIPGVMECGELTALFGPPKAGKSLRALEWAKDLAADGDHTVLYLDRENRTDETWRRLISMGADPLKLDELRYVPFPDVYVDTEAGAGSILELVDRWEPDLVVFDSWARFFASGDQSSDGPANRAYSGVLLPLRKRGTAVLRLDHTGHEGKRPSGTVVKLADIDHGWRLNAKGDEVTLTHTENRTGRGQDVIRERRIVTPALRHVPLDPATPASAPDGDPDNVARLVEQLDRLSIPLDWGRERAKNALGQAGVSARNDDLGQALARRRLPS